jgi:hypothetical protein
MTLGEFQEWLDGLAQKRRAEQKRRRYEMARFEEMFVPSDVHTVEPDITIGVAAFLGECRIRMFERGQR